MKSAFAKLPIPPLPERALGSTDDLYKWAQPLLLRSWTEPYWAQVYFFLAFKIALAVISNIVMLKLLREGSFWIIRPVRIRRGTILVPKATDAVIFFGACFIVVDAGYRIKAIQFFRGPHYELPKRYAVMEGLRLSPAWLASWAHLCAGSLVWPLKLDTLRPLYWHLVFFGVPVMFMWTFVTPMVITDRYIDKAFAAYLPLERELLAAPGAPLTQWMKDQALVVHENMANSAYCCEIWSLVGSTWTFLVFVGELIVGSTLLSRVYKAYSRIPVDASRHQTWSTLGDSAANADTMVHCSSTGEHEPRAKITPLRLVKYLVGVAPLAVTKPEVLEPLPPATVRRILRHFFLHSLTELICMCTLLAVILAGVGLITARTYISVRENDYDARFGNGFMKVTYIFHVAELWAVVIFSSTLVGSMLKREAFPLRIGQRSDSPRQQDIEMEDVNEARANGEEQQSPKSRPSSKPSKRSGTASSQKAAPKDWKVSSHRVGSNTSILPLTECTSGIHQANGSTSRLQSEQQSVGMRSASTIPFVGTTATTEEDVSWYAGHSAGRSIVLAALASGHQNTRVRKAAWRTNYTNNAQNDIETPPSASIFATSHGHGIIAAAVSAPELSLSPGSSNYLTADETVYGSSPTKKSSFS